MFKRISKLNGVGRFKCCSAGKVELNTITVLFGFNTYGKSTLSDVFSSLASQDGEIVKRRLSIPSDNAPQEISIGVLAGEKEVSVKFENGQWKGRLPEPLSIQVFDDGFYHKNLFAARGFTRETKEQFSAFVLGAEGVAKAQLIAEKNKLKAEYTRSKTKLKSNVFDIARVQDIDSFVSLEVLDERHRLVSEKERLAAEWQEFKRQQKQSAMILAREEPFLISFHSTLEEGFGRLNANLTAAHDGGHEEAKRAVAAHVNACFVNKGTAEGWIRQGVSLMHGDNCLFCGQEYNDSALKLVDFYRQSFDDSFRRHQESVIKGLEYARGAIGGGEKVNPINIQTQRNSDIGLTYPELVGVESFETAINDLNAARAALAEISSRWAALSEIYVPQILAAIDAKQKIPQLAAKPVYAEEWLSCDGELQQSISHYNVSISVLLERIRVFKSGVDQGALAKNIALIETSGIEVARKISRVDLEDQCKEWEALTNAIGGLSKEIPLLLEQLSQEQSDFIDSFFNRLNSCFKDFGSRDFELQKGISNRGATPIYFLKVAFRGKAIAESNLDRVFSESDRRALALSVFWASITGLEDDKKRGCIVVLDDPVTSFDSNRVGSVHSRIMELAPSIRQLIMLSHFEHGVADFLRKYHKSHAVSLCKIINKDGHSSIEHGDVEVFIKDEHQKKRDEFFDFISGATSICNSANLRVFLEYELDSRFAQQMCRFELIGRAFGERIDGLFANAVVGVVLKDSLHRWRQELNPDHHVWTGGNLEDQRNTVGRLMDFVYQDLKR